MPFLLNNSTPDAETEAIHKDMPLFSELAMNEDDDMMFIQKP